MPAILDNLVNLVSGLGTTRDKRVASEFYHAPLGQQYLGTLYHNWLFGKVVDIPADDMTRKWRTIRAPSLTIDELDEYYQAEKRLHVRAVITDALKWSRLYGGAGVVLNVNDGLGDLSDPLDLDAVKEGALESIVAVDRYDLVAERVNTRDVTNGFRLPEFYRLSNGGLIHHSRVIRFDGYKLPWKEFQQNNFWGGSVVERVYDDALNVKITTSSIASLIFESSIDVIGVKGLFERIMNRQGLDALVSRFQLANTTKSINKALVIDQENETYQKVSANFAGLPSLVSEFLSVVAAAADIPATRMLGQSAKGFSATGEGDLANYYDMISSKQETDLYDPLTKLDDVLVRSVYGRPVEDFDFEFNPLQQMDEKELAEINRLDVETARAEYDAGVISLHHWAARVLDKGTYPTLDAEWVESLEDLEQFEADALRNRLEKASSSPVEPSQTETEGEGNDVVESPMYGSNGSPVAPVVEEVKEDDKLDTND